MRTKAKRYMSGLPLALNPLALQGFSRIPLAESWARQSASPQNEVRETSGASSERLGAPLTIRQAAELIGCSAWTVRQTHLPNGLPCFRSGPNGKLIFYHDQVVQWILSRQQKGGRS